MTKYEKVNTVMSGLALLLAIASPFIAYRWLDPQMQSFRHRARLHVTPYNFHQDTFKDKPYKIEITNIGQLPAKDVLMTLQYLNKEEAADTDIQLLPPIPVDIVIKEDTKFVTLKKSIASQDMFQVQFTVTPKTVWVATEFGETTIVDIDPLYKSLRDNKRALDSLEQEVDMLKKEREHKDRK